MNCEHICDTFVYECIVECGHDTPCMRDCWKEHDRCAINCPCNAECPDGCSEPYDGHPCDTWFCQDKMPQKVCAAREDPKREPCDANDQPTCEAKNCCWEPYYPDNQGVPWCHQYKIEIVPIPKP